MKPNEPFPAPRFVDVDFEQLEPAKQMQRAEDLYRLMSRRRTIREYSDRAVPLELIEKAIATAGTAPSGANMQPWRFVVVKDVELKRRIRLAAKRKSKRVITIVCQPSGCGVSPYSGPMSTNPFSRSLRI